MSLSLNNNQLVSLDGNIGSGKTSLFEELKKEMNDNKQIIFLKEPVDEWDRIKDENGITMLEKFYENQEKYSFPFQMMAFISRLVILKNALKENTNSIIITERCLHTDKMVFAKMLYDSGKIEKVNYDIYLMWFNHFIEDFPVSKIIYVNTKPQLCFDRIKKRSRNGESNVSIDYLEELEKYHISMFQTIDPNKERLEINGNVDIYENNAELQKWIENINIYINK